MLNEPNVQRILDYLRQHAAQYNLETLRQQLLGAGHSADDVAAAIARYQQEIGQTPATDQTVVLNPTPPQPTPVIAEAVEPVIAPNPPSVPDDATDEAEIERVVAYLDQNQQQYNLRALRRQLLKEGMRSMVVDAAIRRVQRSTAASTNTRTLPYGCLGGIVNCILLAILLFGVNAIYGAINAGSQFSFGVNSGIIVGVLLLEIVVGIIWSRGIRKRLGNIVLLSVLFTFVGTVVIGVVVVVLGFGVCIAFLSGAFGN